MALEKITIEIDAENASQKKALEKDLQTFAKLSHDDRSRISQLMNNNKALNTLAAKWTMLKMMF
ncbi:MAG: hypothetical protein EOP00_11135 [Pedobacter sp.]|nr:MAG: hypothetical protein EOP00_11135 [Pedobacter sp.]